MWSPFGVCWQVCVLGLFRSPARGSFCLGPPHPFLVRPCRERTVLGSGVETAGLSFGFGAGPGRPPWPLWLLRGTGQMGWPLWLHPRWSTL